MLGVFVESKHRGVMKSFSTPKLTQGKVVFKIGRDEGEICIGAIGLDSGM
jgi:hypothetical protein